MKADQATASKLLTFFLSMMPVVLTSFILALNYIYNVSSRVSHILVVYRFYRVLYVLTSGIILSASGCLLQSSLKNPLVDHYILGIGSSALFFTYISVLISGGYNPALALSMAISGGLLSLVLVVGIAEKISGSDVAYVLSGISITTLFSGLSLFTYYYVVVNYQYAGLLLVGSFVHSRPQFLYYLLAPITLVSFGYAYLSKKLNTLILGDEHALQLGVNPRATRLLASIIAGTSSSVVVGLFGTIGFIGLMSPHIARFLLKTSDNRLVIPLASSIGALLLYVADSLSRFITAPIWGEVPAGSIVSLIGAPFFLVIMVSRFRGRRI